MTEPPHTDERIQAFRCIGCEKLSLIGDRERDLHQRLMCPRCGTRVTAASIHDYVLSEVVDE